MNYFKTLLLLSVTLMLISCGSDDDDSGGGAQGGSGEVSAAQTTANAPATQHPNAKNAPAAETTTQADTGSKFTANTSRTDNLWYRGRTNGGRPTFYAPKNMGAYPKSFTVNIVNCGTIQVTNNNGRRFEQGLYLVKQSDVPGRGMAVLAPSKCSTRAANVKY